MVLALVTDFARVNLDDTIAAARLLRTRARRACPAWLGLAEGTAPFPWVGWVAAFADFDARVAANPYRDTLLTRVTLVIRILLGAVRRATRRTLVGALITLFARVDDSVAAHDCQHALGTRRWTYIVRFDLADSVAAVPRQGVAVITNFTGLIDETITAEARRRRYVTACGWCRAIARIGPA